MRWNVKNERSWTWIRRVCFALAVLSSATVGAAESAAPEGGPGDFGVWSADVHEPVAPGRFRFASTPGTKPMIVVAPRNGVGSGQVVAAGRAPLRGLKAVLSAFRQKNGSGTIPAESVTIRYATMKEERENADVRIRATDRIAEYPYCTDLLPQPTEARIVPVWVTVRVPSAAVPGEYEATLTVEALGQKPVKTPILLRVCAWTAPDPRLWKTHVGMIQSPDTVAFKYDVPLWSDRHFQLMEATLARAGELGNRLAWIPMIDAALPLADQSMVRYAKGPDGSWKVDFSLVDRYLDSFTKHCGTPEVLYGFVWSRIACEQGKRADRSFKLFTVSGISGAKLKIAYGTPEAEALFKATFDELRGCVLKRGWPEACIMLGLPMDERPAETVVETFRKAAPYARWVLQAHDAAPNIHGTPVGYCVNFRGGSDAQEPGWRRPDLRVNYPYDGLYTYSPPACWRFFFHELVEREGFRGIGRIPADFWNTPKGRSDHWTGGQPTMRFVNWLPAWFAAGPDGACATVYSEMAREGLQELEARAFLDLSIRDKKLSAGVAEIAKKAMAEQTQKAPIGRAGKPDGDPSAFISSPAWQERTAALFEAAGRVQSGSR